MDFKELSQFCKTDVQREAFKLFIKYGSVRMAAKESGKSRSTLRSQFKLVQRYAATKGYAPQCNINHPLSNSQLYTLNKVSDMRTNSDGKPIWYQYSLDREKHLETINAIAEEIKKELPPINLQHHIPKKKLKSDLLNHFTLADTHIGDWASKLINGESDWNVQIADRVICDTMTALAEDSPSAETAMLSLLGDILHFDSAMIPETPRSRHILDSDGCLQIFAPMVVTIIKRVFEILLAYHDKLIVTVVRGNHDEGSTIWLKVIIELIVASNDRVTLVGGRIDFLAYRFGDVLLGWYHGDQIKPEQLPLMFATEYPEMWGQSKHVVIHCGDKHHHKSQDVSKVFVIQHETMNARNRYSSGRGLQSARGATRYTYHKKEGRKGWGHEAIF